ncbi:MAG TPA: hypothetical protein VFA41_04510 [Ktedonobacteraceae bacterium]|jgi:hypothetical protein|nr:hypothetical protein [Ktedonobacteraceae bacterium]
MPDWLSQIQTMFSHMPAFLVVFFVVVAGFIALMFVLFFLGILWSIIRLLFGSGRRRSSLYNSRGNSAWQHNMGNPMNPNSPLNPNSPINLNNPMNPNNPFGWTNPNSPNNPNGWNHPASPNNPHNRMHKR